MVFMVISMFFSLLSLFISFINQHLRRLDFLPNRVDKTVLNVAKSFRRRAI